MRPAISARGSTARQPLAQPLEPPVERRTVPGPPHGEPLHPAEIVRDAGDRGATRHRPGLDRGRDRGQEGARARGVLASPERLARHDVPQRLLWDACARGGGPVEGLEQPWGQAPQAHRR
jgi:hypothetical protein